MTDAEHYDSYERERAENHVEEGGKYGKNSDVIRTDFHPSCTKISLSRVHPERNNVQNPLGRIHLILSRGDFPLFTVQCTLRKAAVKIRDMQFNWLWYRLFLYVHLKCNIDCFSKFSIFERLLRSIYHPQNLYCVHVDKKSPREFLEGVKKLSRCFPNVFVATKLSEVYYSHWSRVEADINCFEDLVKR